MRSREIEAFFSFTNYERLVDMKKLGFIFSALKRYAYLNKKDLSKLRVLEVGCGNGGITLPLGSLGCHIKAFDIDDKSIRLTRRRLLEKGLQNVDISLDDGCTFDDGVNYDVVIASEVLEHLCDPPSIIRNISRRMSTGSYFIVTVPNGFGPWELRNRIFWNRMNRSNVIRRMVGRSPYVKIPGNEHETFFCRSRLVKMLSCFSFHLENCSNADSFFAAFWMYIAKPNMFLEKIDVSFANRLPYWCASGWFFLFVKKDCS